MPKKRYILDFSEIDKEDIALAGGKGANLGEMVQAGFPVPPGFVISAGAYRYFLDHNDFQPKIKSILTALNHKRPQELQAASEKIRKILSQGNIPDELKKEIVEKYGSISGLFKQELVAVRSSATAEDLPGASFAGQQETFLNVQGDANLLEAVRRCWSSLFTPRAIFYRGEKGFSHFKVNLAVIVQEMVQSEISGTAFTVSPTTGDKHKMVIEAVWGLGELIVQGSVTPDKYEVERHSLEILGIEKQGQEKELVRSNGRTKERSVPASRRNKQKLSEEKIKELAKILQKIHTHYFFPQDIEWAYSKGKFYVVQSRPITTLSAQGIVHSAQVDREAKTGEEILKGQGASPGIATGVVKIVESPKRLGKIKKGDILVTKMTSPDFVPAMKLAAAIVTDAGGVTSHAAIVSRELGIPCVVGTGEATSVLKDGLVVTVDGKAGMVRKGDKVRDKDKDKESPSPSPREDIRTATRIYVNLAEPERAKEIAELPVDGVGLLRAEFMLAQIGVHPKHAVAQGRHRQYISKLTEGLTQFCKHFYPRPVVYRATDFKTNEYRNLDGGKAYEPEETNPMLGFRGAYRYIADPDVFELELAAVKKVREEFKNLWMMIPFVRSPQELLEVKRIMAAAGLMRGPSFKLWLMIELPVNVILIDDFIKVGIDGVSVGSNDLTMLITGTDRDNSEVAQAFDERSPAVLWALKKTIRACRKHGVTSSICGQAPSSYDDLVEYLVRLGITSISVNPDAVGRVQRVIYEAERRVVRVRKLTYGKN
ncbi:MAG: phosphoenolpyruvate synthase [Candidatus Blackburnbacteria bacterium]|nr:phosphoenolpyruvate synthase [Candidatus Blackburnbacteria bacterium]